MTWCDVITILCLVGLGLELGALSWLLGVSWRSISFFLQRHGDNWHRIACLGNVAWTKMDDDLWAASSDGPICVDQYRRFVNGGRTGS